jgi:hypothetical protein
MFLASDRKKQREDKVRRFQATEPGISLLLAAVNFEWTVCRAVLFLSRRPNSELRALMGKYYSLDSYKELWNLEVVAERNLNPLAIVVRNWSSVRKAFEARNRLIHGRDRYTKSMAMPHVDALLQGTSYVDSYCELLGYPLFGRMPIRRLTSRPPA